MSGKTVTKTEVRKDLRGVSAWDHILSANVHSMQKAAKHDENTMLFHENYKQILNERQKSNDSDESEFNDKLTMTYFQTYEYLSEKFRNIGASTFLENYSISWSEFTNYSTIYVSVDGQSEMNNTELELTSGGEYQYIGQPISSVINGGKNFLSKCFTMFSSLSSNNQYKTVLDNIYMFIRFDSEILYSAPHEIYLSIHSPLSLPEFSNNWFNFEMNKHYMIQYYRLDMTLLGSAYETNCKHYGLDDHINISARSDCIADCLRNEIYQEYGCVNSFEPELTLLREETLMNNQDQMIIKCNKRRIDNKLLTKMKSACLHRCEKDCHTLYFNLNSHSIEFLNKVSLSLRISHSATPDIILQYLPETTFISFVCSFGGLLGMWMGLSFMSLSRQFVTIFRNNIYQRFSSHFVRKNNITIKMKPKLVFTKRTNTEN